MHELHVTLGDQVETRRIGLRSAELVTQKDAAGLGFKVRINGRDIFCKGANWIPQDALAGRITGLSVWPPVQRAVSGQSMFGWDPAPSFLQFLGYWGFLLPALVGAFRPAVLLRFHVKH